MENMKKEENEMNDGEECGKLILLDDHFEISDAVIDQSCLLIKDSIQQSMSD